MNTEAGNQNANYVDLAEILTDEDRRLLITDLGLIKIRFRRSNVRLSL